jgi:hypothetical protein
LKGQKLIHFFLEAFEALTKLFPDAFFGLLHDLIAADEDFDIDLHVLVGKVSVDFEAGLLGRWR